MDVAPAPVQPVKLDLARQMQNRRSRGERLNQAAGGSAGSDAG